MAPQPFRDQTELLRGEKTLFPRRAGTEIAGEIAHVGDLHINPFEHGASLPFCVGVHCTTICAAVHHKILIFPPLREKACYFACGVVKCLKNAHTGVSIRPCGG